jgi:CXXC-20-CXXC protein
MVNLSIQKCEFCRHQFVWGEIQKAIWWRYKPIQCKKCGLEHNVTFQSRMITALFIGIITAFLLFFSIGVPFDLRLMIAVVLPLINILIFPYYAKYKANN